MRSPVTPKLANELSFSSVEKLKSKLRANLGGEPIQIQPIEEQEEKIKIQLKPILISPPRKLSLDDEIFKKKENQYYNKCLQEAELNNSEKNKSNSFSDDSLSSAGDTTSFGRLGADLAMNKQKSLNKQRANSVNGDELPNGINLAEKVEVEKIEETKEGGGWWSYLVSPVSLIGQVFTSTEEAVSMEQLEQALAKEVQEIDSSLILYQNQIN